MFEQQAVGRKSVDFAGGKSFPRNQVGQSLRLPSRRFFSEPPDSNPHGRVMPRAGDRTPAESHRKQLIFQ
jgi:hypothetical protein